MRPRTLWLVLGFIVVAGISHADTRISGTYVMHSATYAGMLQLTQTENGQISGVISEVTLKPDGKVEAKHGPVTGTIDSNQLTLNIQLGLSAGSLAGTVNENTIQLQVVGSKGELMTWVYVRATPSNFQTYADQLKSKSQAIILTTDMQNEIRAMEANMRDAIKWMAAAETHIQRIPRVKNYYQRLDSKMSALLAQERATVNSVARTQISVAIIQGNVAGIQTDVEVNGIWDEVERSGNSLGHAFEKYPASCGSPSEFQAQGASQAVVENWETTCAQALGTKDKFNASFQRVAAQHADLKAFQAAEARRREALVQQGSDAQ